MFAGAGEGGHAAVAVHDRGQALTELAFPKTGAEDGGVRVTVDVEEAGRDAESRRIDRPGGACAGQIAASGDDAVLNGKVAGNGGRAGAVDQKTAANQNVEQNCHLKSA